MRTKNSINNILASFAMSILVLVVGFITQRVFVHTLDLEFLGVNGLFTNIISMLGVIELGLGSAIVYHLYKPMADRDSERIKSLLHFYKSGYRAIAVIVTIVGLLLVPFLPSIVGKISIPINLTLVYILFLMDVVFSYLLAYKRSIFYADQKNYLVNLAHLVCMLVMNGLQIAILIATKDFYLYLIIKIVMRVAENLVINAIVNKRYGFLNEGVIAPIDAKTRQDIFKKVKALLFHKIGNFIVLGSDNIIISVFLGIATVGLYSNYYLVIVAIGMIVDQLFMAITASVGSLLITSNASKAYGVYNRVRFANFWLATVAAIGLLVAMDSLVTVWLGDAYTLAVGVLLALSVNLYLQLTRSATNSFKEAAGIFHEDRYVPLVESLVNIVLSIIFLQFFGLAGVFMGTICSNLVLHLFSYPKFVYTRLFKRSYLDYYIEFVKYLILALIAGVVTFAISRAIVVDSMLAHFVINVALSVIVPSALFYVIYRNSDEFIYFKDLIKKIFAKIKSRKYIK